MEEVNSQSHHEEKEDALNATVLGNSKNNDYSYDLVETNSQLGESEMKGMEDMFHHLETKEQVTSVNEMKGEAVVSKTVEKVIGHVEVPAKDLEISNNFQESRVPTSDGLSMRAREDLRDMGLGLKELALCNYQLDLVVEIGWFFAMSLFLLEYVEWKQIDFAVSSGYESFNGVVCKEAVNPLHAHVFIVNDFKDWNGVNIRIEAFKI
ncbi:hypothetical protein V6N12_038306 [Hibiscus sabdariffa]|uniref:Uncharacterized protein n=1 Tax=Hibiscus sabdariffa TaxID=183260 RepID=A0ABR2BEJ6_9ROSI